MCFAVFVLFCFSLFCGHPHHLWVCVHTCVCVCVQCGCMFVLLVFLNSKQLWKFCQCVTCITCVCVHVCIIYIFVCVCVPRKRFFRNYWSHHCKTWHGDYHRYDNASHVNYIDLDLHSISRSHLYLSLIMKIVIVWLLIFRNYSSNANRVCCEDSLSEASPMTLTFIQSHKCVSNLTTF